MTVAPRTDEGGQDTRSAPPLLSVRNLRKHYQVRAGLLSRVVAEVKAVDGVSFDIGRREVLGLAGESGSGKSTIGRSVLRLIEPSSGEIRFEGEDVVRMSPSGLGAFRRRAQIIFQDPYAALDPTMTIGETLEEPLIVQKLASSRAERRDRVAALLESVSLPAGFAARLPAELSGGQRQRVVIARALAVEPTFIVADEPVSALDVSIQAQVINLLEELKERLGLAMLFISHDIAVMEYLSDRIAVLYLGRLMEVGPSRAVTGSPKHPYTEALISAVPDNVVRGGRGRIILTGDVPDPLSPPSGCVFRSRCPYALPACAETVPALREVAPGRLKACIRDDILQDG